MEYRERLTRVHVTKYRTLLNSLLLVGAFLITHRYNPVVADLFAVFLVVIFLYTGLHIYFMPVQSKLKAIAKYKKRHGLPLDQPHKADEILKEGYFRVR